MEASQIGGLLLSTSQFAFALRYPIRFKVVLKYLGQLNIVLSMLVLAPFTVSLLFRDYAISFRYGVVAVSLFALGIALSRLPGTKRIQTNEAMGITAFAFLFAPLMMSYPMMGADLTFIDALFESISAVTTTGLSTTATMAGKSETFQFARAWMQWYGGLGIVVLALAIMIQPGLAAKRLGSMGEYEDDLIGATRSHVRHILLVYGILTALGIAALVTLGVDWWDGMLYTFSAVSTGGFSPYDGSLTSLEGLPAQATVTLLSVAGAISFIFYRREFRESWRVIFRDRQTQTFLLAALLTSCILIFFLRTQNGLQWLEALLHGMLNGISAQSTAGFSSLEISHIDPGSKLVLVFSMLTGGCIGSTAGGIKVLRLLIFFRLVYLVILRTGLPKHAVADIRLEDRRLENDEIQNTLVVILLFILFIGLSWVPFVVMGHDPLNALFEVTSAIGTVGLSAGITTPDLHPFLKSILCADMLLGRLEILVWLVLLTSRTWIGKRWEE